MPGLLQHKADLQVNGSQSPVAEHPEELELWLPSRLLPDVRSRVCIRNLPGIEEKLRTAQCHDALNSLRHVLKIKSRLIQFKNKNVRGQREGLRSREVINRVHDRARVAAEKYRTARAGMLQLVRAGDWEQVLKVLADADIREYQEANRLKSRVGRLGIWEDEVAETTNVPTQDVICTETTDFTLFEEEPTRRDGTGEIR
jgi:hypothetical protein